MGRQKKKEELDIEQLEKELLDISDNVIEIPEDKEKKDGILKRLFVTEDKPKEEVKSIVKEHSKLKKKGFTDVKGLIKEKKDAFYPERTMLVNMELRNGFHTTLIIFLKKPYFTFANGNYIIDDDFKYYDVSSKLWCLDYHQDISFPIKRHIDVNKINKLMRNKGVSDVDNAINPMTLKQLIESDVVQKVMKGAELDEVFKFLKLMIILTFIGVCIIIVILIKSTGILSGMKVPFL